ncbi:hypothetical protein NL676_015755 [Syzygium grande]|nr:hypothetical protein NL676_015755 [Syzygium grande]
MSWTEPGKRKKVRDFALHAAALTNGDSKPREKDHWSPTGFSVGSDAEDSGPLKITWGEPATHWNDAFPIGNGPLGAMIWGGVASETLQLNGTLSQFLHLNAET